MGVSFDHLGLVRRFVLVLFVVGLFSSVGLYGFYPVANAVDKNVDLIVKLEGPAQSNIRADFTFVATVENKGPESAEGSSFRVELDPGTTNVSVECVSSTDGSSCISDTNITPENTDTNTGTIITGRINSLGVNGRVVFNVKGKFARASSANTKLSVSTGSGFNDTDPDSNSVVQQTALDKELDPLPASVRVTKS